MRPGSLDDGLQLPWELAAERVEQPYDAEPPLAGLDSHLLPLGGAGHVLVGLIHDPRRWPPSFHGLVLAGKDGEPELVIDEVHQGVNGRGADAWALGDLDTDEVRPLGVAVGPPPEIDGRPAAAVDPGRLAEGHRPRGSRCGS